MFSLLFVGSLILGACIGSFLNVVIYRYGTSLSPLKGRSRCATCNKNLAWYELIPVLSFIYQKGRCRGCKEKLSWQYPLVEIISAILFGLVFIRQYGLYSLYSAFPHGLIYSIIFLFFYFTIASLLLVIAVYDFRHKIIPQGFVYTFIILSLVKLLAFAFVCLPATTGSYATIFSSPYIFDFLSPIIFFIPFWFLWFISKGAWIGFGDAKLAIGIGALLGFVSGLSAIILGFWIGAGLCLILMAVERFFPHLFGNLNGKSEIPLAPFLILGTLIVLFSHIDVLGIAQFFTI
jgi:leader peptidase (prepilin peptidase)/N-methyltransferase